MSRRTLAAVAAALTGVLVAGCAGKPVDPLAQDRARLLALHDEPLPADWPAEAAIYAGPELMRAQLDAALADIAATAHTAPPLQTPLGAVHAVPRAEAESVTLSPSTACPGCVEVNARASGIVDISWQSPLGAVERSVPFELDATATLELALLREGDERSVRLRAVEDGAWDVQTSSPTLPPELSLALSGVLGGHLARVVKAGLLPELPLFTLARDDDLPLRGIRARTVPDGNGGHVVAVELAFVVLEKATTGRAPNPRDGFVLAVPNETLLGIARAGALRTEPQDGYAAEPTAITVDGDSFIVDVKVWKVQAKPVADTFRVHGRIALNNGEVQMSAERVELQDAAFDLNPIALIERAAIIATLQNELNAAVPARVEEDVALARRVAIELTDARGVDGALHITGRVRLLTPES